MHEGVLFPKNGKINRNFSIELAVAYASIFSGLPTTGGENGERDPRMKQKIRMAPLIEER